MLAAFSEAAPQLEDTGEGGGGRSMGPEYGQREPSQPGEEIAADRQRERIGDR